MKFWSFSFLTVELFRFRFSIHRYLAPERAKGDVHDERISDAWSMGEC